MKKQLYSIFTLSVIYLFSSCASNSTLKPYSYSGKQATLEEDVSLAFEFARSWQLGKQINYSKETIEKQPFGAIDTKRFTKAFGEYIGADSYVYLKKGIVAYALPNLDGQIILNRQKKFPKGKSPYYQCVVVFRDPAISRIGRNFSGSGYGRESDKIRKSSMDDTTLNDIMMANQLVKKISTQDVERFYTRENTGFNHWVAKTKKYYYEQAQERARLNELIRRRKAQRRAADRRAIEQGIREGLADFNRSLNSGPQLSYTKSNYTFSSSNFSNLGVQRYNLQSTSYKTNKNKMNFVPPAFGSTATPVFRKKGQSREDYLAEVKATKAADERKHKQYLAEYDAKYPGARERARAARKKAEADAANGIRRGASER